MGDELPRPSFDKKPQRPAMTTAERHKVFLTGLKDSHPAVWLVGLWLSKKGYVVQISPSTAGGMRDEWAERLDGGDLFIGKRAETAHPDKRIEVKHLAANFTGPEDWPHRPKFIVNAVLAHDRAQPKPYAYVIVSQDMEHIAVVFANSRDLWYVEPRDDKRLQRTRDFYFCPMHKVVFHSIVEGDSHAETV